MSTQTYSIKEVSQLTQLSADTIRYYEKIGLLPPVNRNSVGFVFLLVRTLPF